MKRETINIHLATRRKTLEKGKKNIKIDYNLQRREKKGEARKFLYSARKTHETRIP